MGRHERVGRLDAAVESLGEGRLGAAAQGVEGEGLAVVGGARLITRGGGACVGRTVGGAVG